MERSFDNITEEVRQELDHSIQFDAERTAFNIRNNLISTAIKSVNNYLNIVDRKSDQLLDDGEFPLNEPFPIYVLKHTTAIHYEDNQPISTRSILFKRSLASGQEGNDQLEIHVPCDENGNPIENSNRIFYKRVDDTGNIRAYCIAKDMFYEFESGYDADDGKHKVGIIDQSRLLLPLDSNISDLGQLYDDMRNMKVFPQRLIRLDEISSDVDS